MHFALSKWCYIHKKQFGVYCGFLQNSRKYGLGSLRKTPTEGISPLGPGHTSGQLALNPTTKPTNLSHLLQRQEQVWHSLLHALEKVA